MALELFAEGNVSFIQLVESAIMKIRGTLLLRMSMLEEDRTAFILKQTEMPRYLFLRL